MRIYHTQEHPEEEYSRTQPQSIQITQGSYILKSRLCSSKQMTSREHRSEEALKLHDFL